MGQLVMECRKFNDMLRRCDIDAKVGCSKFLFWHKAFIRYPDGTVNRYSGMSEIGLALYLIEEVGYLVQQDTNESKRRMSKLVTEIQMALCDQDKKKLNDRQRDIVS